MVQSNYVPRVTQLDAVELDDEVIQLLKNQLMETFKYLPPSLYTPFVPEFEFALRSIVFKYSLLERGKSFGQEALSLKYNDKNLSRGKLYWLYGYTVFIKYIKDRLMLSHTSSRRAQSFISALEKFQIIGDFFNLVRFLQTGKNVMFIDYLLNLETVSEKVIMNQYTDYSWTRELLWNSFIELFGVLAPYVRSTTFRRIIREKTSWLFRKNTKTVNQLPSNYIPTVTKNTKCVECNSNPILPHYMGCEHIFCQYCLQSHKQENPNYSCPKCGYFAVSIMMVPAGR